MISKRGGKLRFLLIVTDALVIAVTFFLAFEVRAFLRRIYPFDFFPDEIIFAREVSMTGHLSVLPIFIILYLLTLNFVGIYNAFRRLDFVEIIWAAASAVLFGTGLFGAIAFGFKLTSVNRSFIVIFSILSIITLSTEKIILQKILRQFWQRGIHCKNILIVGTGHRARQFAERLEALREFGYQIMGFVDDQHPKPEELKRPYLGRLSDIPRILRTEVVDLVAFVVPRSMLDKIGDYIHDCELQGKEVTVAIDLYDHHVGSVCLADLAGIPVLQFETTFLNRWDVMFKRLLDVVVSGILIFLLSPILLAIALLIKKVSPDGPVFFRQKRCGLNGRVFNLLKFRTMVPNAEELQKELQHLNEASGPVFKITNDPRIIPYGRFLRKFSLDELPQLFNVFVGHMSLVGPRPPIPKEVEDYDDWQRRKLSVRPGITCIWQVSGRNRIAFEDWMRLDLQYIDNWSLWLDFKILLKTIPAVLAGSGK